MRKGDEKRSGEKKRMRREEKRREQQGEREGIRSTKKREKRDRSKIDV